MPAPMSADVPAICREGLFVRDAEVATGVVIAEKAPFFQDVDAGCPDVSVPACKMKAYVVRGDVLAVAQTSGDLRCAWFIGAKSNTVGWVREADLVVGPSVLGDWKYGMNELHVTATAEGLRLTGLAFWHGLGDNVHIGELDGLLSVDGGALVYDHDGCMLRVRRAGDWLVASDNGSCGGANVYFDGMYHR